MYKLIKSKLKRKERIRIKLKKETANYLKELLDYFDDTTKLLGEVSE